MENKKGSLSKIFLSTIAGNALEFYDLALLGFLAPTIAHLFFSSENPRLAAIGSLGTFAIAFVVRPLGAILFGHFGDRVGRKRALVLSITMMCVSSTLIGCLPTYENIGVTAPILLICCRFIQGIAIGSEYNGAAIFALEHYEGNKRSFFGSLLSAGAISGYLLASGISLICTQSWMPSWGWRLPFFFGLVIAAVGLYIRRNISETPAFTSLEKNAIPNYPLMNAFITNPLSSLATIGFGISISNIALMLMGYMTTYLVNVLHIPSATAMFINVMAISILAVFIPIMGYLGNILSSKVVMMISAWMIVALIFPIYTLTVTLQPFNILMAQGLLAILTAGLIGPSHSVIFSLFPAHNRYSGACFNYTLGAACGGVGPIISEVLIQKTQNITSPAFFIMLSSVVTIVSLILISIKNLKQNFFLRANSFLKIT